MPVRWSGGPLELQRLPIKDAVFDSEARRTPWPPEAD
jgi:hypothetical protein